VGIDRGTVKANPWKDSNGIVGSYGKKPSSTKTVKIVVGAIVLATITMLGVRSQKLIEYRLKPMITSWSDDVNYEIKGIFGDIEVWFSNAKYEAKKMFEEIEFWSSETNSDNGRNIAYEESGQSGSRTPESADRNSYSTSSSRQYQMNQEQECSSPHDDIPLYSSHYRGSLPEEYEIFTGCRFHAPRRGHIHQGVDYFASGIAGSNLSIRDGGQGYLISAKEYGETAGYGSSWLIRGESGQWYLQRNFHAPRNIDELLNYSNYEIKRLYSGAVVAVAGSTGCNSSGAHFHLETYPVSNIDAVLNWLEQREEYGYWTITELKQTDWVGNAVDYY